MVVGLRFLVHEAKHVQFLFRRSFSKHEGSQHKLSPKP